MILASGVRRRPTSQLPAGPTVVTEVMALELQESSQPETEPYGQLPRLLSHYYSLTRRRKWNQRRFKEVEVSWL